MGTTTNATGEIKFSEMQPNDTITLKTENSVYTFRVKDASRRIGDLEGGRMEGTREVVASGAVVDDEFWGEGVKQGGRALFFVVHPTNTVGFNRLLTSEIEELEYQQVRAA